ncbi:bacterial leucyl aminopeptidase [Emericellopsis atlantica]|uniref:Peptide hydrolase n=1 Tax=Emericellopsis atlantica TaxID=2614577 RepID=A0A9P7ZR56_9HYPO|nr:bacterial leucyl aminopeptidase [Emericellopsis atlantica]KAG9256586.1 bacterial leucyl aminopeptidase [Emericellopsis atlantica]
MRTPVLLAAGAFLVQVSHACRATEDYSFEASNSHSAAAASSGDVEPLRLLKTSDDDPGTWVTEEEKIHEYMLKHVHFMDVTETQELEELGASRHAALAKRQSPYPAPSKQSIANPIIARLVQSNVQSTITGLSNIYNRYYRGSYAATSASYVLNAVRSAASTNPAITVKQFTHSFNQPSVIATIPGTSSQRVIVTAHYDSINSASVSGRAPGADDNASGVASILEALRALAAARYAPGNTLEFHFYGGEEGGLLGARDVFNRYAADDVDVLAVMNQDMTGYSTNNVIAVYTDYVDASLTTYMQRLVPVYTTLGLVTDRCGYGCSDHAAARAAGYPASYVCADTMSDSSPYIHTANDTPRSSFYAHALQHSRLTVGFLVEASFW